MSRPTGSVAITHGFRVSVTPQFLPDHSSVDERRWVFAYRIRISNESERTARLVSRRWLIINSKGTRHEVEGEGVVGQQPTIAPGESFTYASFCPLDTPWGTMEGSYTMEPADEPSAAPFDIDIARFFLVSEPAAAGRSPSAESSHS